MTHSADEIELRRLEDTAVADRSQGCLRPGEAIGRYIIEKKLGGGGSGLVYRARHVQTGRAVALKVLRGEVASDATTRARFLREARVGAQLAHSGIVSILDFDFDDGRGFLVMELIEGEDLRKTLRAAPLPRPRVATIFHGILEVLEVIHSGGVVHRDLKPGNVRLLEGDRVKILDFGIARLPAGTCEPLTRIGAFVGTPAYASPEQLQGRETGPPTDLYAVALMLFHALTGRPPFLRASIDGVMEAHLKEAPPTLAEARPELATETEVQAVVSRALRKDPAERFRTAREFKEALVQSLSPGAQPAGAAEAATDERSRALVTISSAGETRSLFLVAGTSTCFGRSDCDPRRGTRNDFILRVLPIDDNDNRDATRRISNTHGELLIEGTKALVIDRSSRGTWLDGTRLARGVPTPIPDVFKLGIAGETLALEGEIVRGPDSLSDPASTRLASSANTDPDRTAVAAEPCAPVQAIVLRRTSNTPGHIYALLAGTLRVGPSPWATIPVAGLAGVDMKFHREAGRLEVERDGAPSTPLVEDSWCDGACEFRILEPLARHFSEVDHGKV